MESEPPARPPRALSLDMLTLLVGNWPVAAFPQDHPTPVDGRSRFWNSSRVQLERVRDFFAKAALGFFALVTTIIFGSNYRFCRGLG